MQILKGDVLNLDRKFARRRSSTEIARDGDPARRTSAGVEDEIARAQPRPAPGHERRAGIRAEHPTLLAKFHLQGLHVKLVVLRVDDDVRSEERRVGKGWRAGLGWCA